MQRWFEQAWQNGHPLLYLLLPFNLLFIAISSVRSWLFKVGVKTQITPKVPVVVVGNISVGGNGKTPVVLYLVELLRQHGYKPGIISRGYGGDAKAHPIMVTAATDASQSGDEPLLLAKRSGAPVAVGADRPQVAEFLLAHADVNVIISDDGMQHYRLGRHLEVAVVDGNRRFGNGFRLPMGPLREPVSRLKQCDFVVCNGGQADAGETLMTLEPSDWRRVNDDQTAIPVGEAIAMAGIGHPPRFYATVEGLGISLTATHSFADHSAYSAALLAPLAKPQQALLMTEKDAVKCREFAQPNWYYLPVSANLGAQFDSQFLAKLKEKSDGV